MASKSLIAAAGISLSSALAVFPAGRALFRHAGTYIADMLSDSRTTPEECAGHMVVFSGETYQLRSGSPRFAEGHFYVSPESVVDAVRELGYPANGHGDEICWAMAITERNRGNPSGEIDIPDMPGPKAENQKQRL